MTAANWLAVHHAPALTLATRQWLVPAAEAPALASCISMASELAQLRAQEAERIGTAEAQARLHGHAQGHAEGHGQALADAAEAIAARLQALGQQQAQELQQLQAALVPLALLVVRRVAGNLAPADVLAALVRQAVGQVLDPLQAEAGEAARCVVRLHPTLLGPVQQHLGPDAPSWSCQADATLAPLDVVIETPAARVLAGFETQLQRVQAALASLPREALVPSPA